MTRTFNLQPYQVSLPTTKQLKNYFHNNYEFKGMIEDTNFMTVDQKSFQECNNVYVNEDGLLRSRPGLKYYDNETGIKNIWTFGSLIVKHKENQLIFNNNGQELIVDIAFDKFNFWLKDRRLFVLAGSQGIYYYDLDTNEYADGQSLIYVPITNVFANGVQSSETTLDSKNVLTSSYKENYIYDTDISTIDYSLFNGKTVDVKVDNDTYNKIVFKGDLQNYLTTKKYDIKDDYFDVQVGNNGVIVLTIIGTSDLYCAYSVNDTLFRSVKLPSNPVLRPTLSRDGNYLFTIDDKKVKVLSLIATEEGGSFKYSDWTTILDLTTMDKASTGMDIDNIYTDDKFSLLDLDALDDSNFCLLYPGNFDDSSNFYRAMHIYSFSDNKSILLKKDDENIYAQLSGTIRIKTGKVKMFNLDGTNYFQTLYYSRTGTQIINTLNLVWNYFSINDKTINGQDLLTELTNIKNLSVVDMYSTGIRNDILIPLGNKTYWHSDLTSGALGDYDCKQASFTSNGNVFSNEGVDYNTVYPFAEYAVYAKNGKIVLAKDGYLYTNNISTMTITVTNQGELSNIIFDNLVDNQVTYLSKDNTLYISSQRTENNRELLYIPEINNQQFDHNITNMSPISSTETAIFTKDNIYYTKYDETNRVYYYFKTKIDVGCLPNSDVITTFDGTYTIFCSERGLVAMSYQQFVASTDQTLTYLSDTIHVFFKNYFANTVGIKLYKYSYWILSYDQDKNNGFVIDTRTMTWWPMSGVYNNTKFVTINNKPILLANERLYKLSTEDTNYWDEGGVKIDWKILSQKLYLDAINYYKHIINMTFMSVHKEDVFTITDVEPEKLDMKLKVLCYRKRIDGDLNEDNYTTINFTVNTCRTFVQRVNYGKVNEFQYLLTNDEENFYEIPLSLTGITIKFKIGDQVR